MNRARPLSFSLLLVAAALVVGCPQHTLYRGGEEIDDPHPADADVDDPVDADEPPQCGDEREPLDVPPEPIVNGTDSWDPEVVDLEDLQALSIGAITMEYEGEWFNVCTATLVSPTVVLTAAHCLLDPETGIQAQPSEVRFVVGEDAQRPLAELQPVRLWTHPRYSLWAETSRDDVAVMILDQPATELLPGIQPLPVNCDRIAPPTLQGQLVQHVGYGVTDPLTMWELNTRRWWTVEEVVEVSSFEFVVFGWGETGVCFGDSGGPALWTMPDGEVRVIGVASMAEETCVDHAYFTQTRDNCDDLAEFFDGCSDETYVGRCDLGEVAVFCEDERVQRIDCGAAGQVCGNSGDGTVRCVDPPDRCEGESFAGRCDGHLAIWCQTTTGPVEVDCAELDMTCRLQEGLYRCGEDPCHGLSWEGQCLGDVASWCDNGIIRQRRCDDCGQSCGWSEDYGAFYCVD